MRERESASLFSLAHTPSILEGKKTLPLSFSVFSRRTHAPARAPGPDQAGSGVERRPHCQCREAPPSRPRRALDRSQGRESVGGVIDAPSPRRRVLVVAAKRPRRLSRDAERLCLARDRPPRRGDRQEEHGPDGPLDQDGGVWPTRCVWGGGGGGERERGSSFFSLSFRGRRGKKKKKRP